jgi:peptidoglycan hydrolase-like protein with peptidoglycan-binding domain
MHAVETLEGVDLAFPVATAAAIEKDSHEPEVLKQSFEAFKARKEGRPVMRLPAIKIIGRRNGPPRSELLTGVQYRLNAAGFGAGPVDGINGPKTNKAVTGFQKTYGLKVDGIPGPRTQEKLVEVCGF